MTWLYENDDRALRFGFDPVNAAVVAIFRRHVNSVDRSRIPRKKKWLICEYSVWILGNCLKVI